MTNFPALQTAIDADAYDWLTHHAPIYLDAIEAELQRGATPEQIFRFVLLHVGSDRSGIAFRCQQAARHIANTPVG